ncbi:PREDICTED: tigger transposable element-derived protein 2 [Ceratosolen solmsi marchali]|uniref:Tigger transposable element-derived protein 2 n=1 Tax=Ceratosolen solmsi marchali TaxID=326594 RepID=A0AAJ7E2P9_9HYME|nr:PREDICTED: tigger transposable element-derived protein 2 [Ceratosolen solmsi marchali]
MSAYSDNSELFCSNNICEKNEPETIYINSEIDMNATHKVYLKNEFTFPQLDNVADNPAKRRVKNFSLQEKVRVLDDVRFGRSKAEVRKEYGIGESTLRRWVHDEQKIRDALHDENSSRKKLRNEDNPYVGEALIAWYNRCKQQNVQLSGLMLREKALELNNLLSGKENFAASNDWFSNWKKKYGLPDFTFKEEKKPIEDSAVNQLMMTLRKAVEDESLLRCQIFKCDKTALNYKSLPNRRFPGDRITIMSCTNADGSFKLPLVVLGKSIKSTSLVNLQNSLPIFYSHQTTLWVDTHIMNEWFDNEFAPRVANFLKDRNLPLKTILIAENVPSDAFQNRPTSELQIHLILHNLSLIVGPFDNEILESIKLNYEYKLLRSIISAQNDGESMSDHLQRINLRDFIYWISNSWDEVRLLTIVKCWEKFLTNTEEDNKQSNDFQEVNVFTIFETLRGIREYRNISEDEVAKWIAENNESARLSIDNHIIEIVKDSNEDLIDDAENLCEENKILSANEAINGLNVAMKFFEQNGCATISEMMSLVKLKDKVLTIKINTT